MALKTLSRYYIVGNRIPILQLIGPQAQCKLKADQVERPQHISYEIRNSPWHFRISKSER